MPALRARPLLALLFLGGLVYANALMGEFILDDQPIIVLNDHLRSWSGLPVLLTSEMHRSLGVRVYDYYRPLTVMSFFLDSQLWGLRPFGYHLTSIVLHLVTAMLVYLVWARLTSPDAALLGALVWMVHPVHVEAVAYIASRGEIWYTLWGLTALLLVLRERIGGSLLALAAALLSKETAVILPAVLVVVGMIRGWPRGKLFRYGACCAFLILGYMILRVSLGMALTIEHGRELAALRRGLLALKVLGLYGELMVWPLDLQFPRAMAIPKHLFEPVVLLGALMLGSGLALTIVSWKKSPAVAIGISWFLLGLVPVSNLTLLNVPLAEHWLYFPSIGLCGVAGIGAVTAARTIGKLPLALMVGVVVGLLAVRTMVGNAEWRTELRVALKATRGNPESPMGWTLLGTVHARRGENEPAVQAFKKALDLDPRDSFARRFLGQVYAVMGNYAEAEKHLRIAVALDPRRPWSHYMLAEVLYEQGKLAEAVAEWQKALAVDPLFKPAQTRLRAVTEP